MSSVWQQEPSGYSPCVEIDSSSVRTKDRLTSPTWLKQEQDELRIIKWENFQTGPSADAVQDNTPSSAMSGKQQCHLYLNEACSLPAFCMISESASSISSGLTCREPAPTGAAHYHQAAVHAGQQTRAHYCSGETGGGPDAGSQVSEEPD